MATKQHSWCKNQETGNDACKASGLWQAVSAHEGGMPLTRALEDGNGQGTRQGVILGGEGSHLLWNKDGALDTQFGLSCQRGFI